MCIILFIFFPFRSVQKNCLFIVVDICDRFVSGLDCVAVRNAYLLLTKL